MPLMVQYDSENKAKLDTSLGFVEITKGFDGSPAEDMETPLIDFKDTDVYSAFLSSSMPVFHLQFPLDRCIRLLRDISLLEFLEKNDIKVDMDRVGGFDYDSRYGGWRNTGSGFDRLKDAGNVLEILRRRGYDAGPEGFYEESKTLGTLLCHLAPGYEISSISVLIVPQDNGEVGVYADATEKRRELRFGNIYAEPVFAPLTAGILSEHKEFFPLLRDVPDLPEWRTYDTPELDELFEPIREFIEDVLERSRDGDVENCPER